MSERGALLDPHDPLVAHCRAVIERGSRSFAATARLFDPRTRAAAYLLYAWCRHCDDVVDCEQLGFRMHEPDPAGDARLGELSACTRSALRGEASPQPAFQALQRVVALCGIPERYPLELLEGFAMDVAGRRHETLEDLLLYCYHVAGVVGVMMAHVMGASDPWSLQRAADLGLALQMTNVARDVLDDAGAGRVYLPLSWLKDAGLEADELLDPRQRPRLALVATRLLGEAERYYDSGAHGLRSLSWRSAWAVASASGVYREIGRRVLARGARAWDRRVVVSPARKLQRVALALPQALGAACLGRARRTRPGNLWSKRQAELD